MLALDYKQIGKISTGTSPAASKMYVLLSGRSLLTIQCVAMFLVIVGARFWLIGKYGSDLPFWDQWDAEGAGLYKPAYDGNLSFRDWFAPHNEHRIFFTRLVSFGLKTLNCQWDARVQMVVNATFYTSVACGLFIIFAKGRSYLFGLFFSVMLAAVFSCPFGWENTLAGFQSQFYFLTAFSLTSIWLMINKPFWSWGWVTGVLLGFCSLFSMASGLLAPLAVLCFVCLELTREWRSWREQLRYVWPLVTASLLIMGIGAMLVTKVDGHSGYMATGAGHFISALFSCLAWPQMEIRWWAIACWFPAVLLVGRFLLSRVPFGKEERFLVTVSVWMFLQAAAMAYSRSTIIASSRYSDLFSLGVIVNILSLIYLFRNRSGTVQRSSLIALCVVLLAVNGRGMYRLGFNGASEARKSIYDVEKYRTAGFIATGDFRFLVPERRKTEIPYPDSNRLAGFLNDPALAPILPVSVRKPISRNENLISPVFLPFEDFKLEILSPYPWEKIWPLSASGELTSTVHYSATKTTKLPFLRLFVLGDVRKIYVTDSKNRKHGLSVLSGAGSNWQEVYVYCPGTECRIDTSGTTERILFSEPKEMGALSLAAALITSSPSIFLYSGLFVFFCLIMLCLLKRQREPHAETEGTLDLQTNC